MRDLGLFNYERKGNDDVITQAADAEGWRQVRDSLIATVGMNGVLVIRVLDGDPAASRNGSCRPRLHGQGVLSASPGHQRDGDGRPISGPDDGG